MDNYEKEYKAFIENFLQEKCFVYPDQPQQTLFDAMRYSLFAGGKRLRPIMTLEFCRMCCGDYKIREENRSNRGN